VLRRLLVVIRQVEGVERHCPPPASVAQEWREEHSDPFLRRVVFLCARGKCRMFLPGHLECPSQIVIGGVVAHEPGLPELLQERLVRVPMMAICRDLSVVDSTAEPTPHVSVLRAVQARISLRYEGGVEKARPCCTC
jgi:hypothetical protein